MKIRLFPLLLVTTLLFSGITSWAAAQQAPNQGKPFDMPVASPAGPSTWLLGQPYGNTTGAYAFGSEWYEAGQQLHFGIDISMPCGTPLVAVADGLVVGVDDLNYGAGPHNLIVRHEAYGVSVLYGHLLERPPLVNGQQITRGQEVALSGDPDGPACNSRPHLHFEVRSIDYRTTYNPVSYINAAWHSLSNIGSFNSQDFERDLDNPRRWMTLFDQPAVSFGGRALNNYAAAWPPLDEPPTNPPLYRDAGDLARFAPWRLRQLAYSGCCFWPWWSPTDSNRLYGIDGSEGIRANIYEWQLGANEQMTELGLAPPTFTSPDGTLNILPSGDQVMIQNTRDGAMWGVPTNGNLPGINTDNTRILWLERSSDPVPGLPAPDVDVWMADINGENARRITTQRGGYAVWLDAERALLVASENQMATLSLYNSSDDSLTVLGTWARLRGLDVAPGGERVAFYLQFQDDPTTNGVYVLGMQPGAQPEYLPWFGSWRWRDVDSLYYIPFNPTSDEQVLAYYDLPSGENRPITDPATPFSVANGDWSVSADGHRIAFLNAADLSTWLIEEVNALD